MSTDQPAPSRSLVNRVDQVKVFNLFAFFGGDVERTASAAQCDVRIVEALAHDFCWADKLKGRNRLDTADGLTREQENNRAANYHVAKQMMEMISSIVNVIADDPAKWCEHDGIVEVKDKDGNVISSAFSSKPLVEIAKATQIVQDMSYRALGDKIAAKAETTEASKGEVTNLAINIYAGLQNMAKAAKSVEKVAGDITTGARAATGAENGVVADV